MWGEMDMTNWNYGVSINGSTRYFDNKQQAQWLFLAMCGEGKKPFAFQRVDEVFQKVVWNPTKILNDKNAPFKVVAVAGKEIISFNFISVKKAVNKVLSLGKNNIKAKLYLNINGIDFVEQKNYMQLKG